MKPQRLGKLVIYLEAPPPDDDFEMPEFILGGDKRNDKPSGDLGPLTPTFELFVQQLRARLAQGAREYGDSSFDRPTAELLDEIEEELVDVAG